MLSKMLSFGLSLLVPFHVDCTKTDLKKPEKVQKSEYIIQVPEKNSEQKEISLHPEEVSITKSEETEIVKPGEVNAEENTTPPEDLMDDPVPGSAVSVTVDKPDKFKQGSSAIIFVEAESPLKNPQISFAGKTSKLYPVGENKYRGVAAVDAIAKTGGYTLKASDDSGKLNFSEKIEVLSGHYPTQNIRISGSKSKLTATEEELKKVEGAKENITDKSYWSTNSFQVPTKGCVISKYGVTRYHNGKPTGDFHRGLDIKASNGTPINAVQGGKVIVSDDFRLHGKTVAIDHGQGLMSIYIHMSERDVKEGDVVAKGDLIGKVGSTGFATGPHLHWGLYVNGVAVNPSEWTGPVRVCR